MNLIAPSPPFAAAIHPGEARREGKALVQHHQNRTAHLAVPSSGLDGWPRRMEPDDHGVRPKADVRPFAARNQRLPTRGRQTL